MSHSDQAIEQHEAREALIAALRQCLVPLQDAQNNMRSARAAEAFVTAKRAIATAEGWNPAGPFPS
jgi:hypothetical protein